MAMVTINPVQLSLGGGMAMPAFAELTDPAAGACIPFGKQDTKTVILVKNGGEQPLGITFAPGDSVLAGGALAAAIPAGETHAFVLESGRHKFIGGEKKGMVWLTADAAGAQAAAIILP